MPGSKPNMRSTKMKRRVLEKIKISEISAVDRPCQEGATVRIMKRQEPHMHDAGELTGRLLDLQAKVEHLSKQIAERAVFRTEDDDDYYEEQQMEDLNQLADAIRLREGCTGTQALAKARREHPDAFTDYQQGTASNSGFEQLVTQEMHRGCYSREAAMQRVLERHGPNPDAAAIKKRESAVVDFMDEVDATMIAKRGISRTDAMREVRRRNPDLYHRYQEC